MLQNDPAHLPNPESELDDFEWAERSAFWLAELAPKKNKSPKRSEHLPLILGGHGVRMNVENGALIIRNGRTHHPQIPRSGACFAAIAFCRHELSCSMVTGT